ncbi:hypothetical protein WDM69_02880 [Moraxella lincolnii]|nr:hypothetical protein [Moraxella lincolnii]
MDPKQAKTDADKLKSDEYANNFKSVFDQWLESKDYSPATWQKMQTYSKEILAVIGDKPVSQITTAD